jgi:hypothetical protein
MNKTMEFTVFCLESYKQAHRLTGKESFNVFNEYKVFDYIKSFYDVMHSTGQDYIVEDIDAYIKSRQH